MMMLDETHQNRRKMINLAAILFLMFINRLFIGPSARIYLNIFILVTYTIILFIPQSWWTKKKILIAALILLAETAAGVYWIHEMFLIYLLSIIIFSITIQFSWSKSSIPIMVALFLAAMLYIRFGKENVFSILSFVLLTIVLYFTIRMRLQRNEMYQVNKWQFAELQDAYEQLQEASVTSMQFAVLEERTRIAREIHDAVGHSLTSLIVQMQAMKYMVKKDQEEAEKSLDSMLVVARQGLQDIRTSVHSLAENQVISGSTPLKALLSRMESTASIKYEFHSEFIEEELSPFISGILFRVLQEAITNIIRHSQATFVDVRLTKGPRKIMMRIKDNGTLNANDRINEGFGLKGMEARLKEKGGSLNYSIMEPNGFELTAEIPLDDKKENEG